MEIPAIFLTRIGVGIIIFGSYRHSQGTFTNAESAQKVITSLRRDFGSETLSAVNMCFALSKSTLLWKKYFWYIVSADRLKMTGRMGDMGG